MTDQQPQPHPPVYGGILTGWQMIGMVGMVVMMIFATFLMIWFMGTWTSQMPTSEQLALASLNGTAWYQANADPSTLIYVGNVDEGNGAVSFNFQVKDRNGTSHDLRVLKVPDPWSGSRWSEFVDEKQVG